MRCRNLLVAPTIIFMPRKKKLGLPAILAVVIGDMIGSGIFFIPGELTAIATSEWQVYFFGRSVDSLHSAAG